MNEGALPHHYHTYDGTWHEIEAEVIAEGSLTLFVNGRELASLMCTPHQPLPLALGFLANEGFIQSIDEVAIAHICARESCADLWLTHPIPADLPHPTITSGCTGGQTFADLSARMAPPKHEARVSPEPLCKGWLMGSTNTLSSKRATR